MSQPRFAGKTYGRVKEKDAVVSRAFDELFDDGPSKPEASRTAATFQKWGKTKFTSVRDGRISTSTPEVKRRKVEEPVRDPMDPFTFESSDEGGISPKKKLGVQGSRTDIREPAVPVKNDGFASPAQKSPLITEKQQISNSKAMNPPKEENKANEEQFRPVKRFFRTHKGFIEKEKPLPKSAGCNATNNCDVISAPSRLRSVANKNTTPKVVPIDRRDKDDVVKFNSVRGFTSNDVFCMDTDSDQDSRLSSKTRVSNTDPDWLSASRDNFDGPPSARNSSHSSSSALPSVLNRTKVEKPTAVTTKAVDSLKPNVAVSPGEDQLSDAQSQRTQLKAYRGLFDSLSNSSSASSASDNSPYSGTSFQGFGSQKLAGDRKDELSLRRPDPSLIKDDICRNSSDDSSRRGAAPRSSGCDYSQTSQRVSTKKSGDSKSLQKSTKNLQAYSELKPIRSTTLPTPAIEKGQTASCKRTISSPSKPTNAPKSETKFNSGYQINVFDAFSGSPTDTGRRRTDDRTMEDGHCLSSSSQNSRTTASEAHAFADSPGSDALSDSQESQSQSQGSAQSDSQSSQSGGNKRTLLRSKLLSNNSPKPSPAKRYNPRQWIQDGSPPEVKTGPGKRKPGQTTGSVQSLASAFDMDEASPAPVPTMRREARMPVRKGVQADDNTAPVMAVKVSREHKELYTVVQNVKDVHECQEHGETQEFHDDISYLLDGLQDTQSLTTRCLSTLSLANKCIEPVFRMHLRAHGTATKIFSALHDACHNPCLAMSASLIMFMLSRDRLSVDVDQDGMEMMINLLNADNKYKKLKPGVVKDFERIRQRVQHVIAQLKKDGGAKNMEISEISTSNLATETLLALSSRRSGDSFKEEMRQYGGLDHIVEMVGDCTDHLDEDVTEITDSLIDTMKKIDRCLRVLENVTYLNSDNQTYLISYSSSSLVTSLCSLLKLTGRIMAMYPALEPTAKAPTSPSRNDDEVADAAAKCVTAAPGPSQLVFQCMLSVLRVLLNITHDNVWGSQKVGQHEGLMGSALLCALHVPQYAPLDERFDLLVLSLGMIINLVEHCELNRRLLVNTETVQYYDSPSQCSTVHVDAIEALTQLFLQKESAACQLEDSVTLPGNVGKATADKPGAGASASTGACLQPEQHKNADESGEWQESDSGLLWVIGKKTKTNKNQNAEDDDDDDDDQHIEIIPSTMEDEENFTKALHKAGKHMEDSIVAAYVALLIGCIIRENQTLVERVREHLPENSFESMVNILTKFLGFMNLTSGVAAHSSKSIADIIKVMDKL